MRKQTKDLIESTVWQSINAMNCEPVMTEVEYFGTDDIAKIVDMLYKDFYENVDDLYGSNDVRFDGKIKIKRYIKEFYLGTKKYIEAKA